MSEQTVRPFTAMAYFQFLKEKKLMGSRCAQCGAMHLPPRALCPTCHNEQMEWVAFSGKGHLSAFTTVFIAPNAMVKAGYGKDNPYVSGIVELDEGARIAARITGIDPRQPDKIAIGTPLSVDFLEEGEPAETVLAFKA